MFDGEGVLMSGYGDDRWAWLMAGFFIIQLGLFDDWVVSKAG